MNGKRIGIVNYGMGNLKSVYNALKFLGYEALICDHGQELASVEGIVLPGVGAFGQAMKNLAERELKHRLTEEVIEKKKPFLGICLGMQLIAEESVEGGRHEGLGWLSGKVINLTPEGKLPVPHVGWNSVDMIKTRPLFQNIQNGRDYYFDHSYEFKCPEEYVTATCHYGGEVVAAIQKDNILATQFHPEKSQVNGLRVLRNFLNYVESTKGYQGC